MASTLTVVERLLLINSQKEGCKALRLSVGRREGRGKAGKEGKKKLRGLRDTSAILSLFLRGQEKKNKINPQQNTKNPQCAKRHHGWGRGSGAGPGGEWGSGCSCHHSAMLALSLAPPGRLGSRLAAHCAPQLPGARSVQNFISMFAFY